MKGQGRGGFPPHCWHGNKKNQLTKSLSDRLLKTILKVHGENNEKKKKKKKKKRIAGRELDASNPGRPDHHGEDASYFVTKEAPARVCAMNCRHQAHRGGAGPRDARRLRTTRRPCPRTRACPPSRALALKNATTGLIDTTWSAVRIGLYARTWRNWLQHFPPSHFLFRRAAGVRPGGEMGRVQDFLGLKEGGVGQALLFQPDKGFPCLKKPEGSSRPRCLGKSKGRPHPQIPSEVLQRLRDFYRPFNHRFYQMSGQDFGWD
ncbi:LOW QUALITY PROTEIN: hypothetical protein CRUP_031431 [Coryphaenoides rupestris]|nr:LOW QUALITY PROTEIN: hypothetical protein CRUP_031431 [Coryphaenoides rupestris]